MKDNYTGNIFVVLRGVTLAYFCFLLSRQITLWLTLDIFMTVTSSSCEFTNTSDIKSFKPT